MVFICASAKDNLAGIGCPAASEPAGHAVGVIGDRAKIVTLEFLRMAVDKGDGESAMAFVFHRSGPLRVIVVIGIDFGEHFGFALLDEDDPRRADPAAGEFDVPPGGALIAGARKRFMGIERIGKFAFLIGTAFEDRPGRFIHDPQRIGPADAAGVRIGLLPFHHTFRLRIISGTIIGFLVLIILLQNGTK